MVLYIFLTPTKLFYKFKGFDLFINLFVYIGQGLSTLLLDYGHYLKRKLYLLQHLKRNPFPPNIFNLDFLIYKIQISGPSMVYGATVSEKCQHVSNGIVLCR